jgi:hypothetical protein
MKDDPMITDPYAGTPYLNDLLTEFTDLPRRHRRPAAPRRPAST